MSKLYAGLEARDPMALDDAGDHYTKHVMAMTAEKLHSKADIAAELGYRDKRIAELEAELAELREVANSVAITLEMQQPAYCQVNPGTVVQCIDRLKKALPGEGE